MASASDELYNTIAKMMKDDDESKKKHAQGGSSDQPSICRVPEILREVKESAYTPRIVSIGPLHRDDDRLQGMQKHKVSYMHTLFRRTARFPDLTLRECVNAMLEAAPRARTCYAETFKEEYSNVELANTLLVDGCFILELFFRYENLEQIEVSNDPVFMNDFSSVGIRYDLLLLENQIPFFVLEELFHLTFEKTLNRHLKQYVLGFFNRRTIFGAEMSERDNGTTETHHILGFLHNYYHPASKPGRYPVMKYSATQLHRTGVKFKASEIKEHVCVRVRTSCFMISWLRRCCPWNTRRESTAERRNHQVSTQTSSIWNLLSRLRTLLPKTPPASNWWLFQLCSSPCLELPPLRVYDHTELFLRNLIAYEQCFRTVPHYITSYAILMDTLLNSNEDVELLENEGVLENHLGATEDASNLFNNLCKQIFLQEFYFSDEWNHLNDYCKLYWPKQLASLRSTYFSNPWAIISLIGALILFGLTAVQTAYSIK